jgi:2-keto-3-deoxy-galactonokinase
VIVSAQVALGTSSAAGANALRLWICYQQNGGALTQAHGIDWVQAAAAPNSVNVYPLTDTITGLAGTYTVGMCGMVTSTNNWNLHDWSYTNVQVLPVGTTLN